MGTRKSRGRENLAFSEKWNQFLRKMAEELENMGGDLDDLFELVLGRTNDPECLVRAIMTRLAIYKIRPQPPLSWEDKIDVLSLLLSKNFDPDRVVLRNNEKAVGLQGLQIVTMGFPLARDIRSTMGSMYDLYAVHKAWEKNGRFPATLRQVLIAKKTSPNLPVWKDKITITGTRIRIKDIGELRFFQFEAGELIPQGLPREHSRQPMDIERLVYVQT